MSLNVTQKKSRFGMGSRLASRLLPRLLKDERGQSTAEYILMLSVVVLIALKFKKSFTAKVSQLSEKIFGKMDAAIDDTGDGG